MPDFSQLTERQREIHAFIKGKIESRGYGPSVREIGVAFEIRSPVGVMCHLKALEKKGLIKREGLSARAIQLMPMSDPETRRHREEDAALSPAEKRVAELEQQLEERDRQFREVMKWQGEPLPCRHCGSLDEAICPRCHEPRR